jgi:hypothetical protein
MDVDDLALTDQRQLIWATTTLAAVATACGATPLNGVTVDPQSLATDLVAHWSFDEGNGMVVGDHSGNGHDGQLTGGTWIGGGRFGGALELASGDYVAVSNFPQATPNWTVSVWTQASAAQLATDSNATDTGTILSTEDVFMGGWQLHLDDRLGFRRYDAAYFFGATPMDYSAYVTVECQCIVENQWVHLTAVFDDDAGQLTLYQDEAVVDSMNMPKPIQAGDSTLYMGRWNSAGRFLAADLDDFAIWSRALSPGEIAVLSQQPP